MHDSPFIDKSDMNTRLQRFLLITLRLVIGWHFLYEGVVKIFTPGWTASGYLYSSRWMFSGFFHWIADTPIVLGFVDLINVWGLVFIGLALILGMFIRFASLSGMVLLLLYYIANPPFIASDFNIPAEGHYLYITKNAIEFIGLSIIAIFPRGTAFRLDHFLVNIISLLRKKTHTTRLNGTDNKTGLADQTVFSRRKMIKQLASIPLLGGFAYGVYHKHSHQPTDAFSGATIKISDVALKDLSGTLPKSSIGELNISRVILGANLIGGYAHARDLIYVSDLFRHYNSEKKVLQTLMIADQAGINSIILTPQQMDVVQLYNERYKGNIQPIVMVNSTEAVDTAIEKGASAIYIIGNHCDWMVRDGKVADLGELLEYIRSKGYQAGLGAHSIQALMACDEAGIDPDFYVKTLHHDSYWSAHPKENRVPFSVDTEKSPDHDQFHDNMFCLFPEKTIQFMKDKQKPWIAFKVLAGGAIYPKDGFNYAFKNGADFICVGMFDFQIVEDVNIAIDVLSQITNRERRWIA